MTRRPRRFRAATPAAPDAPDAPAAVSAPMPVPVPAPADPAHAAYAARCAAADAEGVARRTATEAAWTARLQRCQSGDDWVRALQAVLDSDQPISAPLLSRLLAPENYWLGENTAAGRASRQFADAMLSRPAVDPAALPVLLAYLERQLARTLRASVGQGPSAWQAVPWRAAHTLVDCGLVPPRHAVWAQARRLFRRDPRVPGPEYLALRDPAVGVPFLEEVLTDLAGDPHPRGLALRRQLLTRLLELAGPAAAAQAWRRYRDRGVETIWEMARVAPTLPAAILEALTPLDWAPALGAEPADVREIAVLQLARLRSAAPDEPAPRAVPAASATPPAAASAPAPGPRRSGR